MWSQLDERNLLQRVPVDFGLSGSPHARLVLLGNGGATTAFSPPFAGWLYNIIPLLWCGPGALGDQVSC